MSEKTNPDNIRHIEQALTGTAPASPKNLLKDFLAMNPAPQPAEPDLVERLYAAMVPTPRESLIPIKREFALALIRRTLSSSPELAQVRELIDQQANDEGLWFEARTAPEAYLQQELRKLHMVVETNLMDVLRANNPVSQCAESAEDRKPSRE